MKPITCLLLSFLVNTSYGQTKEELLKRDEAELQEVMKRIIDLKAGIASDAISSVSSNNFGWNDRIGFIIGLGMNNATDDIYLEPVVDPSTNFVEINTAPRFRGNFSFGLSYTWRVIDVVRTVLIPVKKQLRTIQLVEHYPSGPTIAVFVNPITMNNTGLSGSSDLGFGVGWRSGAFSFLGTLEFFKLSQPREYFVDTYRDMDTQLVVNGTPQSSITPYASSIMTDKNYVAIGFKIAYTIDAFKGYAAAVNGLNLEATEGNGNVTPPSGVAPKIPEAAKERDPKLELGEKPKEEPKAK